MDGTLGVSFNDVTTAGLARVAIMPKKSIFAVGKIYRAIKTFNNIQFG